MLNISHFSKTYPGGKRAVEDLSLAVPAGQIVGFIGHNGAGKTTTLRCAAGILDFSEGTIEIDGHDIRREPVAAKQVTAFLPDNPDLYEFMTGVQYLTFIADIYGIPAGARTRRRQRAVQHPCAGGGAEIMRPHCHHQGRAPCGRGPHGGYCGQVGPGGRVSGAGKGR